MKRFIEQTVFVLLTVMAANAVLHSQPAREVPDEKTIVNSSKPAEQARGTLELVFVLDTTGSMGGLLEGAKQRIWGIINEVMQRESRPRVRVGLVAYRDVGDEYVTKVLPITEDLDLVYTTLMEYKAEGGGDEPEDVRRALSDGVSKTGWAEPRNGLAQIVFLVGDAPPQMYVQQPDVIETTSKAVRKNIFINTIQCGWLDGTKEIWQQIARRGEGKYFSIAQDGGVLAIETPYDEELAALAQTISRTYITYGAASTQVSNSVSIVNNEIAVIDGASAGAQAERAVNKALNSRAYSGDLLEAIINEEIRLEDIKEEELPEELKKLSPAERPKEIKRRIDERREVRRQILELSKKRDEFILAERKKLGAEDGFDTAVAAAINEQLTRRGIR